MSDIVELSTGHVFVASSVRAIGPVKPLQRLHLGHNTWDGYGFDVVGVGYVVTVRAERPADEDLWRAAASEVRAEAIRKLMRHE